MVKSGVDTADINRLDKDIYIILYKKNKKAIEGKNFNEKVCAISRCKNEKEYLQMTTEGQTMLFNNLMSLK